jgi:hypothetical protein
MIFSVCGAERAVIILGRRNPRHTMHVFCASERREAPAGRPACTFSRRLSAQVAAASKVNLADVIAFRARVNANSRLRRSRLCRNLIFGMRDAELEAR